MSEKTIENDFDKAVEFMVESDFNKDLNKCLDIVKELDKKDKENKRLNNIINELESYIIENSFGSPANNCSVIETYKILDKLQELKGSDSNE